MLGRKTRVMLPEGERAPEFELKTLEGAKQSLEQILKAGPALFAFYKISCPVCQLTAPYLERLSAGKKIQVIGVSQDDTASTQAFLDRFGVTYPTLLDQAAESYPASNAYGISSVPSLFLVEPDGRISKSFSGFSKRDLEDLGQRAAVSLFRPDEKVPDWKAG